MPAAAMMLRCLISSFAYFRHAIDAAAAAAADVYANIRYCSPLDLRLLSLRHCRLLA